MIDNFNAQIVVAAAFILFIFVVEVRQFRVDHITFILIHYFLLTRKRKTTSFFLITTRLNRGCL
uniref:Uncharacterized protein n=1 Tax=Romanomermis culicivorax TaxID=13658 RepID=A0A915KJI5_ROMCU